MIPANWLEGITKSLTLRGILRYLMFAAAGDILPSDGDNGGIHWRVYSCICEKEGLYLCESGASVLVFLRKMEHLEEHGASVVNSSWAFYEEGRMPVPPPPSKLWTFGGYIYPQITVYLLVQIFGFQYYGLFQNNMKSTTFKPLHCISLCWFISYILVRLNQKSSSQTRSSDRGDKEQKMWIVSRLHRCSEGTTKSFFCSFYWKICRFYRLGVVISTEKHSVSHTIYTVKNKNFFH